MIQAAEAPRLPTAFSFGAYEGAGDCPPLDPRPILARRSENSLAPPWGPRPGGASNSCRRGVIAILERAMATLTSAGVRVRATARMIALVVVLPKAWPTVSAIPAYCQKGKQVKGPAAAAGQVKRPLSGGFHGTWAKQILLGLGQKVANRRVAE